MSEDKGQYLATKPDAALMEQVLIGGDLSKLTSEQRVAYYKAVCESVSLNPLTKPFDYLSLNGKLVLYAKRDAADQLRRRDGVSVALTDRSVVNDVYVVTARATTPDGRADESTGAVFIGGLRGDALANAMMKAETKAKRRVTLSICGMGWLDETEVETIPQARVVTVEPETGEIVEPSTKPLTESVTPKLDRPGAMKRIAELQAKVFDLSGDFSAPHLKNHLVKHYQVDSVTKLADEQLVAFGTHLRGLVRDLEAAQDPGLLDGVRVVELS